MRYSAVPRLSLIGVAGGAGRFIEAPQRRFVQSRADEGRAGVLGYDDGGPNRAQGHAGFGDQAGFVHGEICTPAPTTAMSISVRGMERR